LEVIMSIAVGQLVEHRADLSLGHGTVKSVDSIAGVQSAFIKWANRVSGQEHTLDQLLRILPLPERLAEVGPASRIPFQLKVFARWFESRHSLTGELSNQPFQMLPHQVVVTNRVINSSSDRRAWLLADDVGLGKTIEAGMIMEVLRKSTMGRFRALIITPAGLLQQWQEEMSQRFRREFRLFDSKVPNDLEAVDQLIASIDTLKMKRFGSVVQLATPWDLVIIDEAHHLATTQKIQIYMLAQALRDHGKARNLLFLTATPHSGNNQHFFNMLRLLRHDLFPGTGSDYPDVALNQLMIRNRKSHVTDANGIPIFKGIGNALIIEFAPDEQEIAFAEALQKYLKTGYRAADKLQREKAGQRASALGFVMSTFGKLASSSRAAIESALERRAGALRGETAAEETPENADGRFPGEQAIKRAASGAIETGAGGKKRKMSPIEDELAQVDGLLASLRSLHGPDSKLTAFISRVAGMHADVKLLIFTEYRATQKALIDSLEAQFGADTVAKIHGSMSADERRKQVHSFNEQRPNPRFMVSTEAGGEGLNMQKSCHTVINYDLPWNPMALMQRIGRVYRYGQHEPVVVFNVKVKTDSEAFADQRIYTYLEQKIDEVTKTLHRIQGGNPEDLRNEVLGQVATRISFDDLYKTAVEGGRAKAESIIGIKAEQIQEILSNPEMLGMFRGLESFDITEYQKVAARVTAQHLDFFVRQYLGKEGTLVKESRDGLIAFAASKKLVAVAELLVTTDPYRARGTLISDQVERATVDKELAQRTLGSRLLRFGDPAFESMVKHAQHGGFSHGVASLELPAAVLGMRIGSEGTWMLFDLRIVRQETNARVLRNELASFIVPRGQMPFAMDGVVEHLHNAVDGAIALDVQEARRAYDAARAAADDRLRQLLEEVVKEFGTKSDILPQAVQDVALAWVRAA
jgi:superfamily II DNA or RNA helicase